MTEGQSAPKFECPHCGGYRSDVIDGRPKARTDGFRRTRRCQDCRRRFVTEEKVIGVPTQGPAPRD